MCTALSSPHNYLYATNGISQFALYEYVIYLHLLVKCLSNCADLTLNDSQIKTKQLYLFAYCLKECYSVTTVISESVFFLLLLKKYFVMKFTIILKKPNVIGCSSTKQFGHLRS